MKSVFWRTFWIAVASAIASAVAVLVFVFTGKGNSYNGTKPDPDAAARLEAARKKEEERIAAEIAAAGNEALAEMFNNSIKKEKRKT